MNGLMVRAKWKIVVVKQKLKTFDCEIASSFFMELSMALEMKVVIKS